jgi:hypothetical protein
MADPAAINLTAGHARAGGVKHQMKPPCQPSVGVGHPPLVTSCEKFLYGFKAARRAARAAASAPRPSLSLARRSGRANAGRLARNVLILGPPDIQEVSSAQAGRPCSRCRIVRDRSEPVKAACDRRATAAGRAAW